MGFEATLSIAAILALQKKTRVCVYLTGVGGGVFGNRSEWIADAVARALRIHAKFPIDVKFVHLQPPRKSSKLMMLECDSGRALSEKELKKTEDKEKEEEKQKEKDAIKAIAQGDKAALKRIQEIKALLEECEKAKDKQWDELTDEDEQMLEKEVELKAEIAEIKKDM